jgi:hypothetical protein
VDGPNLAPHESRGGSGFGEQSTFAIAAYHLFVARIWYSMRLIPNSTISPRPCLIIIITSGFSCGNLRANCQNGFTNLAILSRSLRSAPSPRMMSSSSLRPLYRSWQTGL